MRAGLVLAAVLQHVHSNYEIDLFQTLIKAAARETDTPDLTKFGVGGMTPGRESTLPFLTRAQVIPQILIPKRLPAFTIFLPHHRSGSGEGSGGLHKKSK